MSCSQAPSSASLEVAVAGAQMPHPSPGGLRRDSDPKGGKGLKEGTGHVRAAGAHEPLR